MAQVDDDGFPERQPLVIDEIGDTLERFRLLRKSDAAATDELLDGLGASSQVERDIILQLSATRPLGARQFALYAIVITALAWIVVPAGALYVVAALD